MKVVLLSFANKRWHKGQYPLMRLKKEALRLGVFDDIVLCDEDDFDIDYREKFLERFNEKGFGYWQWKSYLIRKELHKLKFGDVLFYCDSGCHLNCLGGGKKRFLEYLEIVQTSKSGVLAVDNGLDERAWTKGDLFKYFGLSIENYSGTQYLGGVVFFRNSKTVLQLMDDWYDVCHNHHDLITDSDSSFSNFDSFVENRHDQSALSLLLHTKYSAETISENEVWPCRNCDWSLLWDKPIWTCRNHVNEAIRIAVVKKIKRGIKNFIKRTISIVK